MKNLNLFLTFTSLNVFLFPTRSMSALNDYLQDISNDNTFDNSVSFNVMNYVWLVKKRILSYLCIYFLAVRFLEWSLINIYSSNYRNIYYI